MVGLEEVVMLQLGVLLYLQIHLQGLMDLLVVLERMEIQMTNFGVAEVEGVLVLLVEMLLVLQLHMEEMEVLVERLI
jgi:hypothetical protein